MESCCLDPGSPVSQLKSKFFFLGSENSVWLESAAWDPENGSWDLGVQLEESSSVLHRCCWVNAYHGKCPARVW